MSSFPGGPENWPAWMMSPSQRLSGETSHECLSLLPPQVALLTTHFLQKLSLAFNAQTAKADDLYIFWKTEAAGCSVFPTSEAPAEENAALQHGCKWFATDVSKGGRDHHH